MIYNMDSAHDCISKRMGLCQLLERADDICYAMRDEKHYPNALLYRRKQAQYWRNHTARQLADEFITILERKRKQQIRFLRFNESGDFRSQRDVRKLSEIARMLKPYRIRVYGYTARRDLDYSRVSDNLIVQGFGLFSRIRQSYRAGIRLYDPQQFYRSQNTLWRIHLRW